MRKILYWVIFLLLVTSGTKAQTNPAASLTLKDSLEILNELRALLDSANRPVSYALATIGIGNRLFSLNNNTLNAKQGTTNVAIYSPSIGYFHKSGFGLTGGAKLLNNGEGFGVNQYSISPSFDLTGNKNIAFGISYTHYFVKNKFSPYASPIQDDLFAAVSYKKTWVQPGIAAGYATGEYNEAMYKDTVIAGITRHFYDSVNYKLNSFSLMLSAGHQFLWFDVLNKSDGLGITPTLMVNAGSGQTRISHKTNAVLLYNFLNKRGRIPKLQQNKFEMQSVGLNLDFNYTVGNFSFEPQYYLDYYLPDTDSKRWSQVFVLNFGYAF